MGIEIPIPFLSPSVYLRKCRLCQFLWTCLTNPDALLLFRASLTFALLAAAKDYYMEILEIAVTLLWMMTYE